MKSFDQLMVRIFDYRSLEYIHDAEVGSIVWRRASGDNVEVLFIEAKEPGKGLGAELYRRMCRRLLLQGKPPRTAVFTFRLATNETAERFYTKHGWRQVRIGGYYERSIYSDVPAVMAWIKWADLLKDLEVT